MRTVTTSVLKPSRLVQRLFSLQSRSTFHVVDTLDGPLESVDIDAFRHKAFVPEIPILLSATNYGNNLSASGRLSRCSLPAVKWFDPVSDSALRTLGHNPTLQCNYLSSFGDTVLPYEYIVDKEWAGFHGATDRSHALDNKARSLLGILDRLNKDSSDGAFHRFNAPLSLLLYACRLKIKPRLYIAQAQIADLPKLLQDELPVPEVVRKAGKGDVYDSNIWLGIPPTYTPLHKDPNPNLFIQLSGSKSVRIFRPTAGSAIFRQVQQSIGQAYSATFRGEEMMTGPERDVLDRAVWGEFVEQEGYQAVVNPGDSLFIPKGWWHSFKSYGNAKVNASVNWWFR